MLLITGCTYEDSKDRLNLENDTEILADRVEYVNEVVPIIADQNIPKISASADSVILTWIAEVYPPEIENVTLQATDVCIKGKKVYISYNVRGETFLGAVDIFSIDDPAQPELVSTMSFNDSDINGLYLDNDYLYLAGARDGGDLTTPAMIERVELQGGLLTDVTSSLDLVSYAGTDVTVAGNYIYVTSGSEGGAVTLISKNNFTISETYTIEDARGVDTKDGDIGVIAGTPARLMVFDDLTDSPIYDYTLTGATIPFSKSTIEINRKKAILGIGDGGTKIICLNTGIVIDSISALVLSDLDPGLTVTNSASGDKDIIFIANGEAGVYVAESEEKFDSKDCDTGSLELLGHLQFSEDESVNHVAYKKDLLFIATGLGGLKILSVDIID
ncbi:MAG: hypothetical protein V3S48_07655 [Candidatus Neomarinimicrobiota bacterium]